MSSHTHSIGTNNRNAPNLYRAYNCFDHLFPYEPKRPSADYASAKLAAALEAFASLLAHKLGAPAWQSASGAHMDAYSKIEKSEKTLYRMLVTSPDAREVTINLAPEERQVYLCRNYLIELSENISQLGDISVFQTCCNYLRYIPCGIGQLRNLKMLILSRNRLVELPDEIGLCRQLREIDVSFNLLKKLPRSLAGLRCLNTVHLAGNRFSALPGVLGKLNALKYLNIGHNPVTHIPLEIFKLPFLLSLSTDNCPFLTTQRYEEVGKLTLREMAARQIIKNNLQVSRHMAVPTRNFLLCAQECSFCGGPFFEHYVEIEDLHQFESAYYPVSYRMCCKHYTKHEDRLRVLFELTMPTVPTRLLQNNMPTVTELFEPYCFNDTQLSCMNAAAEDDCPLVPLISLAKYDTYAYKKFEIATLLDESTENLNILDV